MDTNNQSNSFEKESVHAEVLKPKDTINKGGSDFLKTRKTPKWVWLMNLCFYFIGFGLLPAIIIPLHANLNYYFFYFLSIPICFSAIKNNYLRIFKRKLFKAAKTFEDIKSQN